MAAVPSQSAEGGVDVWQEILRTSQRHKQTPKHILVVGQSALLLLLLLHLKPPPQTKPSFAHLRPFPLPICPGDRDSGKSSLVKAMEGGDDEDEKNPGVILEYTFIDTKHGNGELPPFFSKYPPPKSFLCRLPLASLASLHPSLRCLVCCFGTNIKG